VATLVRELIGREAELTKIEQFLDRAQDGPRVLLLEGEAGIGKSSLWLAGRRTAVSSGCRLLSAAPTEAESALPYAVLGDLLDPVAEETLASLPGTLRIALEAALFRARSDQAPTDQLAVSTAFLRVLRQLAADEPILLAIDDLQWVDGPSRRVLTFAVRRLDGEPVKVLAARRVRSISDPSLVFPNVLGDGELDRVQVGPLSPSAIDDLLLSRLNHPLRRPELDRIYAISEGNPFFALEIGRFIIEHPGDVRAGEPLPIPRRLADAVSGRLTRLPAATRDALVGLVALARSDEAVLQRIDPHAMAALDLALVGHVVERGEGRLRFTHPLLASVVYAMAEPATRRKWHSRLAQAVNDPEERARHLALSAVGPDAAVANALEEAARSANLRGAPDAAATLAQQASEMTPSESRRDLERRQIVRAEYRVRAGDADGARDLLNGVLQSSPPGNRPASALRLMGSIMFASGNLGEAEQLLEEALSRTSEEMPGQALAERDLIYVLNQRGKHQAAFNHCLRLADIARRCGDPSLLGLAIRLKAVTGRQIGIVSPEARALAVAVAEGRTSIAMEDRLGGLHPLMEWAAFLKWSDDFTRARALFKRALALCDGRDESLQTPILFHLAEMECWAGDLRRAAAYVDECKRSVIHTGQQASRRLSLVATATLHCYRGELAASRAAAKEALAIATNVADEPFRWRALAILGSVDLAAGEPAIANRYFDELRSRREGSHGMKGAIRSEGDEVEALLTIGRFDDAEALCARLHADEQVFGDPWQHAIGARCRGLVASVRGDLAAAVIEFDLALTAHQQLPMPLERARTLLCYGTVLRRAKRKRAARERTQAALEIFRSLGAAAWIKRAEAEVGRIAPAPSGVSTLTPTEARVVALVASGRTNKEVAAALFLSIKTVESNLSRIYDKLNLRSRSELIAREASHR